MKNLYIAFNCNLTNHDWSISLLDTEKGIFNIQLERIDRVKHSPALNDGYHGKLSEFLNKKALGNFSSKMYFEKVFFYIKKEFYFLEYRKIFVINPPSDIDYKMLGIYNLNYEVLNFKSHHIFHASSTFYASLFNEAAILTMDYNGIVEEGKNEYNESSIMAMQNIFYGKGNKIELKFNTNFSNKDKHYGIGLTYDIFSSFIGLEEGSIMGLSSYGDYKKFKNIKIYKYSKNGDIYLNDIFTKGINNNKLSRYWNSFSDNIIDNIHKIFGISKGELLNARKSIENSILSDIASKVQKETEDAIVFIANKAYNITKSKNICLAGGVALNILANKAILDRTPFENIFVQPAADDSGLSVGECYYYYHIIHNNYKRFPFIKTGYGKEYSEIEKSIIKYNKYLFYEKVDDKFFYDKVSDLLIKGKIIGFFQGGSEYGPRALGNRSILAFPSIENRDKINKIKGREKWRPLAPVILEEYLEDYFDTKYSSKYMTLVANIKHRTKNIAPGIMHIDGTARYQTIDINSNNKLYNLLLLLNNKKLCPILINTSLNFRGEPIVELPEDALKLFLSSDIDCLVIGNFIINKNKKVNKFKFKNNTDNIHKLIINNIENDKNFVKLNFLYKKIFGLLSKNIFGDSSNINKSYNTFDGNFIFIINNITSITIGLGKLEGNFDIFENIYGLNIGFEKNIEIKNKVLLNIRKNFHIIKKYMYLYLRELSKVKNILGIKDNYSN